MIHNLSIYGSQLLCQFSVVRKTQKNPTIDTKWSWAHKRFTAFLCLEDDE
jgi:hypothetical protein